MTSSFASFQQVVARLRGPFGCPWDREQTHQSLKGALLEEAYEVLEALDSADPQKLKEELGDLLMQVMIHAQIASETGAFDIDDVVEGITAKLIRRHPHVFGGTKAETSKEVLINWEALKREERPEGEPAFASVPKQMPALAYAQAVQARASRLGFDWQDVKGVWAKIEEEWTELRQTMGQEERIHELGDLLFALVNLARWMDIDAEETLRKANQRFAKRFSFMESLCQQQGRSFSDLTFAEQNALWDMAKKHEYESPADSQSSGG